MRFLSFKQFSSFSLNEGRAKMTSSGPAAEDHLMKYVLPYLNSEGHTHTLATEHEDLPAGSHVKLKSFDVINDKVHVHAEDQTGNDQLIPLSKLYKPGESPPNRGHDYENKFVERLKKHGIMPHHLTGAGSTSGTDFAVENRKKKITHPGAVTGSLLNGETKDGVTASMGQLTIHHTKEKGWHISDKARQNRPQYAKEIEKAGIVEHMNKMYGEPEKAESTTSGRAKTIELKHPNLDPAHAYLQDHHVHVLQVGGYGTYSVGKKDETGHGLPNISGKGAWRIREKQKGNKFARTVAFHPDGKSGLNKSTYDLDKDEDLYNFKTTLGHKD
jgi:hypothetical protein